MIILVKKKRLITGLCGSLILIVGFVFIGICLKLTADQRTDYRRLQEENYNGVFLGNYPLDTFQEDVFETYRGIKVVKANKTMKSAKDFAHFLNKTWDSENQITHVYLGVDPYLIWQDAGQNQENWEELLEVAFLRYVKAHPDVVFEILLPCYSLDTWLAKDAAVFEDHITSYQQFIKALYKFDNVIQYFVGGQEWMLMNPANYAEDQVNDEIAQKLLLLCFCDKEYIITPVNGDYLLGQLESLVAKERTERTHYIDLSDYSVIFFGDSILETGEGSHSIPGIFGGLTNAAWYNLAVGGIPATGNPDTPYSLPYMVKTFIQQGDDALPQNSTYAAGLAAYLKAPETNKLVFVLNFGLNDYFSGHPIDRSDPLDVTTYAGALRTGIAALKETYPGAIIVVQTPTYTSYFAEGTEVRCEDGTNRVLQDYVDTAIQVAQELKVYCLDNYYDLGIDGSNHGTYLGDGCHPNEYGRLVLAKRLALFMEKIITNEN